MIPWSAVVSIAHALSSLRDDRRRANMPQNDRWTSMIDSPSLSASPDEGSIRSCDLSRFATVPQWRKRQAARRLALSRHIPDTHDQALTRWPTPCVILPSFRHTQMTDRVRPGPPNRCHSALARHITVATRTEPMICDVTRSE